MKVIHCGFSEISSYELRKSTWKKGRKLFNAGHVGSVREEVSAEESIIFGACIPQTNMSKENYTLQLKVSVERKVLSGYCSCKAGVEGHCKHTAALVLYVNEFQQISCTNEKQQWGIPAVKGGYSQGKTLASLFPSQPEPECIPNTTLKDTISKFPGVNCNLYTVSEAENRSKDERACVSVMESLLNEVCRKELIDLLENVTSRHIDFGAFVPYDPTSTPTGIKLIRRKYDLSQEETKFIEETIAVTPVQIIDHAVQTIHQSECDLWHIIRKVRISSSRCHRIITRRNNFEKLAQSFLEKSFKGNSATNYGIKLEKAAKASFAFKNKVNIVNCGVVISESFPWLCCSPDGLFFKGGLKLLEIKCPYSRKGKKIVNFEKEESYVPYLTFVDHQLTLKKKHSYYAQIQLSLIILKLEECSFYVYSAIDQVHLQIKRDTEYLCEAVPKLESFYYNFLLKQIVNKAI